jgi:hypothetical protein
MKSTHDETREVMVLRTSPESHPVEVKISYAGEFPVLEFRLHKKLIFDGPLINMVSLKKKVLDPECSWACTCFNSDDDGDYVELSQIIDDDTQHDLTIYLARKDQFLLISMAIPPSKSAAPVKPVFEMETIYPALAGRSKTVTAAKSSKKPAADYIEHKETRELTLSHQPDVQIMPLSVPQYRTFRSGCQVNTEHSEIHLVTTEPTASRVHTLVISWGTDAAKYPATWKQIIVAEDLKPVSASTAIAYRFRVGKNQFLYYRSFADTIKGRTALGLHTRYETVVSRLNKHGYHKSLIDIEKSG